MGKGVPEAFDKEDQRTLLPAVLAFPSGYKLYFNPNLNVMKVPSLR